MHIDDDITNDSDDMSDGSDDAYDAWWYDQWETSAEFRAQKQRLNLKSKETTTKEPSLSRGPVRASRRQERENVKPKRRPTW